VRRSGNASGGLNHRMKSASSSSMLAPAASASSTSATRMRVPATIGRPPQTCGSMAMRVVMGVICGLGGLASSLAKKADPD
jgi:hypothetical protein